MQGEDIRALMYRFIIRDSVRLRQSQLLHWKNSPISREGMSTKSQRHLSIPWSSAGFPACALQRTSRENFTVRSVAIARTERNCPDDK